MGVSPYDVLVDHRIVDDSDFLKPAFENPQAGPVLVAAVTLEEERERAEERKHAPELQLEQKNIPEEEEEEDEDWLRELDRLRELDEEEEEEREKENRLRQQILKLELDEEENEARIRTLKRRFTQGPLHEEHDIEAGQSGLPAMARDGGLELMKARAAFHNAAQEERACENLQIIEEGLYAMSRERLKLLTPEERKARTLSMKRESAARRAAGARAVKQALALGRPGP